MPQLSLSDIKARSTGHFFDKKAMAFFACSNWPTATHRVKYRAYYDRVNDVNYVVVSDPWGNIHYHKFEEATGALTPCDVLEA